LGILSSNNDQAGQSIKGWANKPKEEQDNEPHKLENEGASVREEKSRMKREKKEEKEEEEEGLLFVVLFVVCCLLLCCFVVLFGRI